MLFYDRFLDKTQLDGLTLYLSEKYGIDVQIHEAPPQPVRPEQIEPVGNYAISIVWSDHHATGIYRFDFLRDICPCDGCAAARAS